MYKVTCRVVKVNEPKAIEGEETIPFTHVPFSMWETG
jgi:hypothetical protein